MDLTLNILMYLLGEGYFKKAIDHSNAVAPKSRNPEKGQYTENTAYSTNVLQFEWSTRRTNFSNVFFFVLWKLVSNAFVWRLSGNLLFFSWLVGQPRDLLAWLLRDFIRKTALDRELMRSRLEESLFCTIWELTQISEGVIHRGLITPSEICRILHFVQRQNSIIYYSWKYFQAQNILTST